MVFDVKTLLLLNFIINLVGAGTLLSLWQQSKKRYPGVSYWFVNMVFQSIGSLLILLRGGIPDFVSIVVSNFIILCGLAILYFGLSKFLEQKVSSILNGVLLVLFLFAETYYAVIRPDLTMRVLLISIMGILIHIQVVRLVFRQSNILSFRDAMSLGIIFLLYILCSVIRIVSLLLMPQPVEFFKSSFFDSIVVLCYVILTFCLNIGLVLLVNHRLIYELGIQEEKFSAAFHSSSSSIVLSRPSDNRIFEVNNGFVTITGYSYIEAVGNTTLGLNLWVDPQVREDLLDQLTRGIPIKETECRFRRKSGEIFIGLLSIKGLRINNEEMILSSIIDITESSLMKQQLEKMATHDFLTGLPNRVLFNKRFEEAIVKAAGTEEKLAILSLDLDNFKVINDLHGHKIGDSILVEIAGRFSQVLGEKHLVSRFGGDEFLILLIGIKDRQDVIKEVHQISGALEQPFHIDHIESPLSVSIGIALYPDDALDMETLINKSDESMYYVKEHGKCGFRFYKES